MPTTGSYAALADSLKAIYFEKSFSFASKIIQLREFLYKKVQISLLSTELKGASCVANSALSPQHSALSTQHSAKLKVFSFIKLNNFLSKLLCFLFLTISVAHAGVEYGYHPFGETGAFPTDASARSVCIGSSCYTAFDSRQIFTTGEAACNAVLNATTSDGSRNFRGYSFPDFSLKSWGSPYTDFVGNTYTPYQCVLNSTGNGFTFTTSCGFGIFGTCWYPNFQARKMVRCAQNGIPDADWFVAESSPNLCPGNITLTLTPAPNQNDPRPKGTEGKDGKSTLELIARVTENGNPKAGVAVTFAVAVEANSGGHDHHDASRPEGELLQDEDVTDVNGEIKLRFEAPEFAGTHVVAAFCSKCANTSVTKNINVKVPNLIELEGDYSRTAKYELIGSTPKHQGNHFFAPEALIALRKLLPIFAKYDWGVVGINDSSLKWGGRFDIAGRWNGSHHEHLEGKEVDLSFYKPFGTISEKNRQKVYDDLFESKGVGTPQVLWHLKDNPATPSYAHFHVYLLGQSFFRKKCPPQYGEDFYCSITINQSQFDAATRLLTSRAYAPSNLFLDKPSLRRVKRGCYNGLPS